MREYILRHTKCGAVWDASYNVSPEMMVCSKCGEEVRTIYDPIIEMVTLKKGEANDRGSRQTKL